MKNIKDALLHEVKAARKLYEMNQAMVSCNCLDNPFFTIYASIADSIYALIGEDTKTFEESVTHTAITTPYLTDERRASMLFSVYEKNFPNKQTRHEEVMSCMDCLDSCIDAAQKFFDKCKEAGLKLSGKSGGKDDAG